MVEFETISAKIPRDKKRRLKELGVNASELVRRAVDREIAEKEWGLVFRELEATRPIITRVSRESWLRAIRGSREEPSVS